MVGAKVGCDVGSVVDGFGEGCPLGRLDGTVVGVRVGGVVGLVGTTVANCEAFGVGNEDAWCW